MNTNHCTYFNKEVPCFVPNLDVFKYWVKKANKNVVFITIFGSYQVGKSSTLKQLTLDNSIGVGNGFKETTFGAYIYGPYNYNEIRKRFDVEEIEDDDIQVFFIDTEGYGGFNASTDTVASKLLLSQLIAPYAALSNVLIGMFPPNPGNDQIHTIETIFEVVNHVRKAADECKIDTHFLALVTRVAGYFPSQNTAKQKQDELTISFKQKFGENFNPNEIIPLHQYNINKDPLDQLDDEYKLSFKIFAQHLIQHIDKSIENIIFDRDAVCQVFETISKVKDLKDMTEEVKRALNDCKKSSLEKIYEPLVRGIINDQISAIQLKINEINDELNKGKLVGDPEINSNFICKDLILQMDNLIPSTIKDMEEVYNNFKNLIYKDISNKCKEFDEVNPKIKEGQRNFIKAIIMDVIRKKKPKIIENIEQNTAIDPSIIIKEVQTNSLENDLKKTFKSVCQSDRVIFGDIKNEMKQYIEDKIEEVNNEIKNLAETVSKKNFKTTEKQIESNFIKSEVESLKIKLKTTPLTDLLQMDTQTIIKNLKDKLMKIILNDQQINEKLMKNIENKIYSRLNEHHDSIEKILNDAKDIQSTKFKSKVVNDIDDIIDKKVKELKIQIYQSKSINYLEIFKSDLFDVINKSCLELIREAIVQNKAENEDEIFVYLNHHLRIKISKENSELTQKAFEVAAKNRVDKVDSYKKTIDNVIRLEINEFKSDIQNNRSKYLNYNSILLYKKIEDKCKQNKDIQQINDESIKKEIELYISTKISSEISTITKKKLISKNYELVKKSLEQKVDEIIYEHKIKITNEIAQRSSTIVQNVLPTSMIIAMQNDCIKKLNEIYIKDNIDENLKSEINKYKNKAIADCQQDLYEIAGTQAKNNEARRGVWEKFRDFIAGRR